MNFETTAIELSHKKKIEEIRKNYGHNLSSHTFVNLYLWQEQMGYHLYCRENFFTVRTAQGENAWFFPCGDEAKIQDFISEGIQTKDFSLHCLRESDAQWLEENFPQKFTLSRNDFLDEYICSVRGYIDLEGSTYSRIRRRNHRICREHTVRSEILCTQNISVAKNLIHAWDDYAKNHRGIPITDAKISLEAMDKKEQLDLHGILLYIDEKPVSVVAGFFLDEDTLDILLGKSLVTAPRGCNFLAVREYLCIFGQKITYCNIEEDLGIPGLRIQKEEMKPISKNLIWKAVLK